MLRLIKFIDHLPKTSVCDIMGKQLLRSGTSILANYIEANSASSKKDFKNKIHICKKEVQETKHWLRMLSTSAPEKREEMRIPWKEAQELTLIFGKILSTMKKDS